MPESDAVKLVKAGRVRMHGEKTRQHEVNAGETMEVYLTDDLLKYAPQPEIIYEDGSIMIVSKSAGVECEGNGKRISMLDMAERYMKEVGEYNAELGFVPVASIPLAKDVSGLTLIAKNYGSDADVKDALRSRSIQVRYLAIVEGHFDEKVGELHDYVEYTKRLPKMRKTPNANTEHVVTRYTVLAENDAYSLIEAEPVTFVEWQVRMHMSYAGHPVVGDAHMGNRRRAGKMGVWEAAMFAERIAFKTGKTSPFAYLNGREFTVREQLPDVGGFDDI